MSSNERFLPPTRTQNRYLHLFSKRTRNDLGNLGLLLGDGLMTASSSFCLASHLQASYFISFLSQFVCVAGNEVWWDETRMIITVVRRSQDLYFLLMSVYACAFFTHFPFGSIHHSVSSSRRCCFSKGCHYFRDMG